MDLFNIQKLQSVFKTDSLATTKPMNNPGKEIVIHKVNIVRNHLSPVMHNLVT